MFTIEPQEIALGSFQPEKLAEFYRRIFGLEMREKKMGPSTHYVGRIGSLTLAVVPGEEAGLEHGAKGTHMVGVKIVEFDRFIAHARASGLSDFNVMESNGIRQVFFSDPDGNPWMVVS